MWFTYDWVSISGITCSKGDLGSIHPGAFVKPNLTNGEAPLRSIALWLVLSSIRAVSGHSPDASQYYDMRLSCNAPCHHCGNRTYSNMFGKMMHPSLCAF